MRVTVLLTSIVAAAMLGGTVLGQAAGPKSGQDQGRAGQIQDRMAKIAQAEKQILAKLGLSETQKKKIQSLHEARNKHLQEMREKARASGEKPSPEKLREALRKNREDYSTHLQKILTKDQFAKYQELWKEAIKKARDKRTGGARDGGGR